MRVGALVTVLIVSASFVALPAQAPVPSPSPFPPTLQQIPPRDPQTPSKPGTAVIKGRVTAADTGRPLRRSRITITGSEIGQRGRNVSTDADGRYEIKDLSAGRYSITVARSGYLQLRYGQRRPLEQGRQLDVDDGRVVDNIDFALPRMSVIAGRVTDELGEPIEGANVWAMRIQYWQGRRRLVPASMTGRADDAGQYRITGLMPGTYWVMATLRETWTVTDNGKTEQFGYAPTYLPGVTTLAEAQRVVVDLGQQITIGDFSLVPGRAATVSGTALDARGRPLAGGSVSLSQETVGPAGGMFMSAGSGSIAADGTFSIANVSPGEYKIRASTPNREPGASREIVTQVLRLDGSDITGLQLMTTAGWSVSGRIRTDTGSTPTFPCARLNIAAILVSPELEPRTSGMDTSTQIRDDWTFAISNVFGPARMQATAPVGWAVASILHGGRDITDEPFDVESGAEVTDVEVVLTNRVTRLSGQLIAETASSPNDGTVVVFSPQREKWFERSRWVRAIRPDQRGGFEITGLPPGEYLAIALDYVQEGLWNDPEYLASISPKARRVVLREGEAVTVSIEVVHGP